MITSASHRRWSGDIEIADLADAGLPAASIVRTAKIATIEAVDAEPVGFMPGSSRSAIRDQISGLLASVLKP
jgi:mRNA interferase MazF